ncbi:MAG: Transporter [Microgenomates group bacterium GW2011_GWA1_48_10]|nr:MAG: Transporter [Microgenomates group bacterium GW2011_GWA1_48_10]
MLKNLDGPAKGALAIFLAQTIWGFSGPFVKLVLYSVPPMSLLFLRSLFAVLILFPLYEIFLLKSEPHKSPLDKRDIFLAGFLGVFINISTYFLGQKLTTVSDAWVIASTGAIFTVIYCYFFQKERLGKIVYIGIGLAFLGTLVIIGSPILSLGKGNSLGNLLMLIATVSGVVSYLLTKKLVVKFNPLLLAYYFFLISLFCSLPFFLLEFLQNPYWLAQVPPYSWLIIAYLVLGSSIFAYFFSNLGLKYISASIAGTIGYWSPIIAIALGIFILGEHPEMTFWLGSALIVLGLLLAETRHKAIKKTNSQLQ